MTRRVFLTGILSVLILASLLRMEAASAQTMPQTMSYAAYLFDQEGKPYTTAQVIRFSFWRSADAVTSDRTGSGTINLNAVNFLGWQETHVIGPSAKGHFSVQLGSSVPLPPFETLPAIDLQRLHLQIDVKRSGASDTAFEQLDPRPDDATFDRSPVLPVPFALNAQRIDQRSLGTGSGSIPLLTSGGLLKISAVPGGTNRDAFTIDADDSASADVTLKFGETLGKALRYDKANSRFAFNADLRVEGNLTVTGLINGATVGSGKNILQVLHPGYPDAAYVADGGSNVGQLQVQHDGSAQRNSYSWSSTRDSLQDYDIVLRLTLPRQFLRWESTPLVLHYRTSSGNSAVSRIDVSVFDTAGNAVTLSGGSALVSTAWTTSPITFSGSPTWTAGQSFLIKLKASAKSGAQVHVGDLELKFVSS